MDMLTYMVVWPMNTPIRDVTLPKFLMVFVRYWISSSITSLDRLGPSAPT